MTATGVATSYREGALIRVDAKRSWKVGSLGQRHQNAAVSYRCAEGRGLSALGLVALLRLIGRSFDEVLADELMHVRRFGVPAIMIASTVGNIPMPTLRAADEFADRVAKVLGDPQNNRSA